MRARLAQASLVTWAACGPERAASTVGGDASGPATTSSGTLGSSAAADSSTTATDGSGFICDHLLVAPWHAHDFDRVGDLDGDGVHEYIALVSPLDEDPDTGARRVLIANAAVPQPGNGWLAEHIIQEIVLAPGFPPLTHGEVAGLGDVNGDGLRDIGVATLVPDGDTVRARVYVLLGTPDVAPIRQLRLDAPGDHEWWLDAVAPSAFSERGDSRTIALGTFGDLDDDGLDETYVQPADGMTLWVVGGRSDAGGTTSLGDLAATAEGYRITYSDSISSLYGIPTSAGDIDGDGRRDIALGVREATLSLISTQDNATDRDAQTGVDGIRRIVGENNDGFGWFVQPIGDQDKDGRDDIWVSEAQATYTIVSSPEYDPACPVTPGRTSLYRVRGGPAGTFAQHGGGEDVGLALHGGCGLGQSSVVGDLNANGVPDLVMNTGSHELLHIGDAGAALASDAPLLLGYTVQRRCSHPLANGTDFVPSRSGILSGPDLDGDGLDDALMTVDGDTTPHLALIPGGQHWDP